MSSRAVSILNNFKLPTEEGLHHRLICMTGKNKGLSYFFKRASNSYGKG